MPLAGWPVARVSCRSLHKKHQPPSEQNLIVEVMRIMSGGLIGLAGRLVGLHSITMEAQAISQLH